MKKTYINPEMEILEIKNNNIITTSTGQAVFGDDGWSEDIMLDGLNLSLIHISEPTRH